MLKIFISHASADADTALALRDWILSTFLGGVNVFVSSDGQSINPGDDWRNKIEAALREAEIALVICTETSLSRPWLGFEAGAAWMGGATVVPLCYHGLETGSLPLPFGSRQALDLGRQEDITKLQALFCSRGGFDPNLVVAKPLTLPPIRVVAKDANPISIKTTAVFAQMGARTTDLAIAFKKPRPAFVFGIENHGQAPVYLVGGADIHLKEGNRKLCIRNFDGLPLLKSDLLPGQSNEVYLRLDGITKEELANWECVCFRDQIGRQFLVPHDDLRKAIDEYIAWQASQQTDGQEA